MPKVLRNSAHVQSGETQKTGAVIPFDFHSRTRLIFGVGSIEQIGGLAQELGARKVLLVTDSGIVAAGHADRVRALLAKENLKVAVYDRVRENPSTRDVSECVAVARRAKSDLLIGLGGGSSLDTAKGCNFILTNGGEMKDYWGVGKAARPMLPMIAVPTTAGTGSEMQSAALISDEKTHQKMACLDPKAAPRVAILDPELTVSQPRPVTACTGIDAIAHAVESAVTSRRNTLSDIFSRKAFALCAESFATVLKQPDDIEARGKMLLGAAFAGLAIENSMLGAAHSAANPLTAHFGIIHGQAVGLMLPYVVEFNAMDPAIARTYTALSGMEPSRFVKWIQSLLKLAGIPRRLRDAGVTKDSLPQLAEEAAQQWTARFNPKPITTTDFLTLYKTAY